MVEVHAAQEVLVGCALAAVLPDDQAGHRFQDLAGPRDGPRVQRLAGDPPLARGIGRLGLEDLRRDHGDGGQGGRCARQVRRDGRGRRLRQHRRRGSGKKASQHHRRDKGAMAGTRRRHGTTCDAMTPPLRIAPPGGTPLHEGPTGRLPYRGTPPNTFARDQGSWQVSWLAGHCVDRLPKGLAALSGIFGRTLAAYSCGGSRGMAPESTHRVPF